MGSVSILGIILACLLSCPFWLSAQTNSAAANKTAESGEQRYPEQGFLSAFRYTNAYFGFAFDLPADARLEPLSRPNAPDGRLQLLDLEGPPPAKAVVVINAIRTTGQTAPDAKALLRHLLDRQLYIGVEELRGLTKAILGGRRFYYFETRRGIEQQMVLASNLEGYTLEVTLAAQDEKLLQQMESAFQRLVFFPPADARQQAGDAARAYDGPAISEHRLAQLQSEPPARNIAPGEVDGDVYKNSELGFTYRIPHGWLLEKQGAIEPAIARWRERQALDLFSDPSERAGSAPRVLMKACSRTLFSAWATGLGPKGEITYDEFGEVTATAIASSCFPGMKFPKESDDQQSYKNFLSQLSLLEPVLRDMREAHVFTKDGSVVLVMHGSVAFQVEGDQLSRRLSVAMAVVERQDNLLMLFFAAPHDTELRPLLDERAALLPQIKQPKPGTMATGKGGASPVADGQSGARGLAGAAAPGGGGPAAGAPASQLAQPPAQNEQGKPQPESQGPSSPVQDQRPTLLRPGETMQDQQISGKPIPKH